MGSVVNVYINQFNTATDRNLLPLAAGLISSYSRAQPEIAQACRIEIKMLREPPSHTVAAYEDPAVLAFSCYIWNYKHSLEVARLAKIRFPRACIIVGGPSIPRKPGTLQAFFSKYPFIDITVHGEGEITFAELLKTLIAGNDLAAVSGLSFRSATDNRLYVKNADRPRITALDMLPSPFLDGTFNELLYRYRDVVTGTTWETNRGCPFSCTFCDWGQATQAKVTTYGADRLYKELDWISANKIFYVYAADANFGIKKRDIDIARYMGRLKIESGFPGYFMINWMKNSHQKTIEIADTLRDAGIGCQVTLSMQSFDEVTLSAIKRSNIDLDTFRSLKAEYNHRNISTYSELLLGLSGETYNSFCAGVIRAISPFPKDHFNIYLCRILENAEMSDPEYRNTYGLETRWCEVAMARRTNKNATVYEEEEIIVSTSTMDQAAWRRAFSFGYLLSTLYNLRVAHVVVNYLRYNLEVSVKEYIEFLIDQGRTSGGMVQAVLDNLERFQRSILNGETSVLTVEGFGDRYWEPHESSFLLINKDPRGFYIDLEALTLRYVHEKTSRKPDSDIIRELFRFQRLLSPLHYQQSDSVASFEFGWLDYHENMPLEKQNVLRRTPVTLAFSPPKTFCKNLEEFAAAQLTACNSESGPCCTIREVSGLETADSN